MIYKIENFYYSEKSRILSEIEEELISSYQDYCLNGQLELNWLKFFFQKNNLSFALFRERIPAEEIKVQTVQSYLDSLRAY